MTLYSFVKSSWFFATSNLERFVDAMRRLSSFYSSAEHGRDLPYAHMLVKVPKMPPKWVPKCIGLCLLHGGAVHPRQSPPRGVAARGARG